MMAPTLSSLATSHALSGVDAHRETDNNKDALGTNVAQLMTGSLMTQSVDEEPEWTEPEGDHAWLERASVVAQVVCSRVLTPAELIDAVMTALGTNNAMNAVQSIASAEGQGFIRYDFEARVWCVRVQDPPGEGVVVDGWVFYRGDAVRCDVQEGRL
jgi:hypothetical protein